MRAGGINLLKSDTFDRSRWIQFPRDVVIGHDAIEQIASVCTELRLGSAALIIAGPTTARLYSERIKELLKGTCDASVFITDHISFETVKEAEKATESADFIIALGGGTIIDTAKIASYNQNRQFISIPTAASHDGIASSRASVPTREESVSVGAHPPIAVIADTGIIASAPPRLMASGCADIISNYTAVLDCELAQRIKGEDISEYSMALSKITAEILVKNADRIVPQSEDAAWIVIKALVSSGVAMSIDGSSRPASGAEHKFSHALDVLATGKGLHGEQCGIGSIMMMKLHGGDWKSIRDSLKKIGAPTNPAEIGITDETAEAALMRASEIRPERYTILEHCGMTPEKAHELVNMLYEDE